jgi:pyruvate dehydrogenase kinase 2/3/4
LAHRIQDLDRVPFLRDMPSVLGVKHLYTQSYRDLIEFDDKIITSDYEERFSRLVESIYHRHSKVLVQMARGAYEFRDAIRLGQFSSALPPGKTYDHMESTHEFLDRFYLCRIGIRVLIGQYLALRQPPVPHYIGIICSQASPYEIVKRAIDDASFMCNRKYGDAPDVIVTGRLDQTFPYVPTHLRTYISKRVYFMIDYIYSCLPHASKQISLDYILLELLKNSMRATVDWHGIDGDFPPIRVVIADGDDNEDVIIKVSDEGGGIPRSNIKKIWSYLFTTADPTIQQGMILASSQADDHAIDSPLAGLGYGLPISRSYCRYFGGDLSIMSLEGHGTDAFVYLARLGDTKEPLPI